MLIVFLPAVEGLRPQWREATETLGGTTWTYWRRVAAPSSSRPSSVRRSCSSPTPSRRTRPRRRSSHRAPRCCRPPDRRDPLSSEVILGQENVGKAMALAMIVVVADRHDGLRVARQARAAGCRGERGQRAVLRRRQTAFRWSVIGVAGVLPPAPARDARVHHPGPRRQRALRRHLAHARRRRHRLRGVPGATRGLPRVGRPRRLTALLMLVLLVPTMTWVRLRLPGLSRTVEFICLLPAHRAGHRPRRRAHPDLRVGLLPAGLLDPVARRSPTSCSCCRTPTGRWMPACARSTCAPSPRRRARSASWFTVMRRIVLPNLRTAVLSASFLSVALVLGEFTIASLFSKKNLQVAMFELGKSDAKISVAVGLFALAFAFSCSSPCPSSARAPPGLPLARLRRTRTDAGQADARSRPHDRRHQPRHRRPPHRPAPGLRRRGRPRRLHPAHRARRVRRAARPVGLRKTTAPRCLAGLEDPDSGTVEVGGRDLTRVPTNKRDMGMVFQAYSLFPT